MDVDDDHARDAVPALSERRVHRGTKRHLVDKHTTVWSRRFLSAGFIEACNRSGNPGRPLVPALSERRVHRGKLAKAGRAWWSVSRRFLSAGFIEAFEELSQSLGDVLVPALSERRVHRGSSRIRAIVASGSSRRFLSAGFIEAN